MIKGSTPIFESNRTDGTFKLLERLSEILILPLKFSSKLFGLYPAKLMGISLMVALGVIKPLSKAMVYKKV